MTSHPSLNPFITVYGQGKDPASSLGPHWQQPGRSILDNHLLDVPDAREVRPEKFRGRSLLVGIFSKYKFLCANTDIRGVERRPLRQPSPTSPGNYAQKSLPGQYLQTWSSLHTFRERYPGTEDISRMLWDDLRKGMEEEWENGKEEVQIEFPLAILLAKRA